MEFKLSLFEKILLGFIAVLITVGSILYFQNKSLRADIVRKQDSLYVSTQNQSALQSQLGLKADTIQTTAIFVKNLQTQISKKEREYNILTTQFTTAKTDWEKFKRDNAFVSGDSITIPFSERDIKTKTTVTGFTSYYPKVLHPTPNSFYTMKVSQEPFSYSSGIFYDVDSKIMKSRVYADGQLIATTKTEIDSSVYLLFRNNEPSLPVDPPGFLDNLFVGAYTGVYNEDIFDIKTISNYYLYGGVYAGYTFDKLSLTFSKSISDKSFGIGLDYWFSAREILKSIFK